MEAHEPGQPWLMVKLQKVDYLQEIQGAEQRKCE